MGRRGWEFVSQRLNTWDSEGGNILVRICQDWSELVRISQDW